jgi:hypothetical protein
MQRILGFTVVVIAVNLLLRVIPFPELDPSWIGLPDLPGWLGTVLKVKNLVLIAIVIAVIVEDHRKKRAT